MLDALGAGVHGLCCSAQERDGRYVVAEATVTLPSRLDLALDGLWQVEAALDAAFGGAPAEFAVLIAQTFAEPVPRACGRRVSGGRLQAIATARLQEAVTPCPGLGAPVPVAYTAPVLAASRPADRQPAPCG
ncbi:hypothetical protein [Streptomyces sp. HUAS TT7]|uniref:hypothetical protein n=1 Tax=Streptomyces sp. HUAS TT7 TaxID=3447507 RepID=UPI003F65DD71